MHNLTALSLFLFLLHISSRSEAAADTHFRRRLLHQPLFPVEPDPPTEPPAIPPTSSKKQPDLPFSTTPSPPQTPNSFFPSTLPSTPPPPTPSPPPPHGYLATFPANISSLQFPQTPSSSHHLRRNVVAVAVSVSLLSVALVATFSAFLYVYRRHGCRYDFTTSNEKASRIDSLRLFPPDTATSDGAAPKPRSSSNTSTEFLYLGTLPNPTRSSCEIDRTSSNGSSKISIPGLSSSSSYHKLGSPEIKPLPPLPKSNVKQMSRNSGAGSTSVGDDDEGDEEFFSPRGSSPDQQYSPEPVLNMSSSRREYPGIVGVDRFGSRSFNSRTASYPFSNSGSSKNNTASNSPSPQLNMSPISLQSSSPDVMILKFPVPSRPPPPPPPKSVSPNGSHSIVSSPTSSFRASDVSMEKSEHLEGAENLTSGAKQFAAKKLPPPPPPMPPARFWERPQIVQDPVNGPPVLLGPSRPMEFLDLEAGQAQSSSSSERNEDSHTQRPKLKPLHWDKVQASSDRAMVWDRLKSSSFQLNEEMIETLFMVNGSNPTPKDNVRRPIMPMLNQENRVLDPKKSQNVSILLRALNVTVDEVCEALMEGNADSLGSELLECLLKMAPTKEEERKLREFKEDSPYKLGSAEKFLKALLDIPFAFKRVDALLYVVNFDAEFDYLKRSFGTLKAACEELRSSKMFLKLLEAVLMTGNRMNVGTNRGDAHAFKLDTLLKLVDVKGADGKTTLLHFVVQEIVRSEGSRLHGGDEANEQFTFQNEVEFKKIGLQVVSGLSGELTNVKKAATMDSTVLSNEVAKLEQGVSKVKDVLGLNDNDVNQNFLEAMKRFFIKAEVEIRKIQEQEEATLMMVRDITEYFHGNLAKEEAHPLRIFMVVRDFLLTLDRVCREVGKVNERTIYGSGPQVSMPPTRHPAMVPMFPAFDVSRPDSFPSDDEGMHAA